MRRKRFKVRGRTRKEMILLLEEDSKSQTVIGWRKEDAGGGDMGHQLREETRRMKEEGGAENAQATSREEEEAQWVDCEPSDQRGDGREVEEAARPLLDLRRPSSPSKDLGRLRGKGKRGYWVGRTKHIKGRIKSHARGEELVKNDSKSNGTHRVKGSEPRAGTGPGPSVTTVLPLGPNQLVEEDC